MLDSTPPDLIVVTGQRFPSLAGPDMEITPILKGGSDRRYYRLLKHGRPVHIILVRYTDARPDNPCFFPATEILTEHGVRVPKVYHHDPERKLAWIEDLGALDLWAFQQSPWPERRQLYERTLAEAAKIHRLRPDDLPAERLAALMPAFTEELYFWEQNYFFDHFAANFSAGTHDEICSVRESESLALLRRELGALPRFLVHRDFQSQNVIIRDGQPYFIDYQGLRPGRPEYDVASLLFDPYVSLTVEERTHLWQFYCDHRRDDEEWETNDEVFAHCAIQRLMQALGAYGNLALNLGRLEFVNHIPVAVENLRFVINQSGMLRDLLPVLKIRGGGVPQR
jgi:aminoglycoside/choline kinase family phosphotransferase